MIGLHFQNLNGLYRTRVCRSGHEVNRRTYLDYALGVQIVMDWFTADNLHGGLMLSYIFLEVSHCRPRLAL